MGGDILPKNVQTATHPISSHTHSQQAHFTRTIRTRDASKIPLMQNLMTVADVHGD
jgi:hypothetical protein